MKKEKAEFPYFRFHSSIHEDERGEYIKEVIHTTNRQIGIQINNEITTQVTFEAGKEAVVKHFVEHGIKEEIIRP